MEYLIHLANVLYLFSYLMRDILWLRVLTVVGASCLIPYFYLRPQPLMPPIYWNLVFTAINLVEIWRLLLERRPARFKKDEKRLYRMAFPKLPPREMRRLLDFAHWNDARPGEQLVFRGERLDRLMVVFRGHLAVATEGGYRADLRDGQFIGEMSFVTNDTASADVTAIVATRYVSWMRKDLVAFLETNAELRAAVDLVLGADLARKLRKI